jgi:hypothetical protein
VAPSDAELDGSICELVNFARFVQPLFEIRPEAPNPEWGCATERFQRSSTNRLHECIIAALAGAW